MENEKTDLEKEELEKAAESLRNIDFNQDNYKELLEVINAIKKLSENKNEIEEKKVGVPYITDNNNTFIAQENLSPEEFERYAAETDIAFFKEELEKLSYDEGDDWEYKQRILDKRYDIQKKIDELSLKIPHEEEIERKELAEDLEGLQKTEESENDIKQEDNSNEPKPVVFGQTVLPAFVIMTDKGFKTFENAKVLSFDENTNTFLLDNGNNDFFKQRDNTAYNFRHNFGVYCRKEASSPLDAIQIAKDITSRMDKDERQKTYRLLKQLAREDETITQVLVRTYLEAVKEVPLNEEYIKNHQNEKMIARPFYDTISDKGQLVDKDSTLRIGDTIQNLAFNVDKVFVSGKDKVFENLTVISASKEGNKIVLMDKDKSYYEVPRDTLLEGYNKQQEKQHKAEQKHRNANRIDVGWER